MSNHHIADVGLYLQPTLVNNVESFASVPVILREGGQAFLEMGTADGGGTKLICLSGHIKNRGLYEVNLWNTIRRNNLWRAIRRRLCNWSSIEIYSLPVDNPVQIGAVATLRDCLYSYEDMRPMTYLSALVQL